MKLVLLCAFLCAYLGVCFGSRQPIILHTKVDVTVDGKTTSYCEYDGVRILPDVQLNAPEKCGLWYCTSTFDIRIIPCPFDMTGQTIYVDQDNSKPYPECCGTQQPRSLVVEQ